MSSLKGGKTPPRLLQDLDRYNPHRLPVSLYNLLAELAFPYDEKTPPPRTTGKGSCKHSWSLKQNESTSHLADPSQPSFAKVAAFCNRCRCHVDLELDSRGESQGVKPCPSSGYPLHHFRYLPKVSRGFVQTSETLEQWKDTRIFQCTNQACSARLKVYLQSARLSQGFVDILTNRVRIEMRARKAMESDPERFEGHAVPSPLTVLTHLRAYIGFAMSGGSKQISASNKKFMLSLGEDCAALLLYLDFSKEVTLPEIRGIRDLLMKTQGATWLPPKPEAEDQVPYSTELKVFLHDVDWELQVLMGRQSEEELRQAKSFIQFVGADDDFKRMLGCKDYSRSVASRAIAQGNEEDPEHPFYAGLGAVRDFHESLIEFAYDRQCACDPGNDPYYLECLQGIADGRDNEDLRMKVAIEASTGKVSMKDVRDAYTAFGFDINDSQLDEDHIIGTFQSRVSDAPKQEADLRVALKTIGQHRNSHSIEQFAANRIGNYEDALKWLGATSSMDDSFIVNMYGVKMNENRRNQRLARESLEIIAKARKSQSLENFIKHGELLDTEMDAGRAYARLDIADRTVDDDLVLSAFQAALQDQPSQVADLKKALAAIAKDRNSALLRNHVDADSQSGVHSRAEWPVGLENIGNTCYLNSLLQFYFTIEPLRALVLHIDAYKENLLTVNLEEKQVGSRAVTKREIARSQHFAEELKKLFQNMIASNSDSITPDIELARLTLLSSSTEETYRRRSTLKGSRPSLGEIEGKPIHAPQPATISEDTANTQDSIIVAGDEHTVVQTPVSITAGDHEIFSKKSLTETSAPMDADAQELKQQANILENKENIAPAKLEETQPATPDSSLKPLANTSPSRVNEQQIALSSLADKSKVGNPDSNNAHAIPAAPARSPPPVPPRNKPVDKKEEIKKEIEFGAQQDVTEVISNVYFQLQCAIQKESIDPDTKEQVDTVKRLFFGKQKTTTTAKDGTARTKEEFFQDIKLQMSSGPCDIYEAFDAAFDRQLVEVGGTKEPQYTTISLLPPILQLHVSRAQFDKVHGSFKANHHLEFKKTIYMDRYIDSKDPELQQKREECWAWKRELQGMKKRSDYLRKSDAGMSMPEALETVSEWINKHGKGDVLAGGGLSFPLEKLASTLVESSERSQHELEDLARRIKGTTAKINSQFADLREHPYHLHSVIIHRGMVSSGHYWIYIFDFEREIWRKYNDGYVTEVKDTKEIFETEDSPRPATSSFLVYVAADHTAALTDAVCRNLADAPATAAPRPGEPGGPELIQIDGPTDIALQMEGKEDDAAAAMDRLQNWSSELGGDDGKNGGLIREPEIPGHKGVTW